MVVIKRDKSQVPFDADKIVSAISKAGEVDEQLKFQIAHDIEQLGSTISVEEIQNLVEERLMASQYKDVARNYVRYRYKRELIRQSALERNVLEIIDVKNEYVNGENSNKNPQIFSTQRDYIAGEVSKDISMRLLIPPEVVKAHQEGLIHFHDSDYFIQTMHNCCLVNLEDMLNNGTVISKTLIESPHSFHTACNIATQIVAQVASNQYGGQTISLAHLAPFVNKSRTKIREQVESEWQGIVIPNRAKIMENIIESRVREEVKKGIQTIQYQVTTLMTTNGYSNLYCRALPDKLYRAYGTVGKYSRYKIS